VSFSRERTPDAVDDGQVVRGEVRRTAAPYSPKDVMSSNPYAPPQAAVADIAAAPASTGAAPVFFAVSTTKLLVLSFCTLGLYQYFWFYKNWRIVRDRSGESISPFWRTFFAVFFCYQLFDRVRKHDPDSPAADLSAGALAAAWIIPTILWRLPDPYWLIVFAAIFALLPVQAAMNAVNRKAVPDHDPNTRFSIWNWVAVALGGPFFLLAVYGTFMPAP
jgi:hypothetical protein